jgi:hypothetical protein
MHLGWKIEYRETVPPQNSIFKAQNSTLLAQKVVAVTQI